MADEWNEGTVTILFTDVEGSTDLGSKSGDEVARNLMRAHDELIRDCVSEHGGREIKHLGDGFMLAFASTRRAVACAVAIQQTLEKKRTEGSGALPVRMGLNTGEVLSEDDDLFGSAVSAASRITEKASGGEIVVSEVVKALAGTIPGISFRERGRYRLKGFEERWRLFDVVWERATDKPAGSLRTTFVGREDETTQIRAALENVGRNQGSLVLIGGEPGVGKTRLAEEMLREAVRRGYRTLTGRCYDLDSPPPYLPFIELLEQGSREVDPATFRLALGDAAGEIAKVMPNLRQLYDNIPAPLELPPEQERRYLFNSIQEFVHRAASTRPLVVLLDDLHWGDESSLQLLQHIAEGLSDVPVLLLGTYRDSDLDATRPMARTLDNLIRRRLATRIALRRLSLESVRTMLSELAGSAPPSDVVEAIYSETDGNAFFVEEVFKHLSEEGRLFDGGGAWKADLRIDELMVPESVRLVVGRRLERLADATRKTLTLAAVIGRIFTYELLEKAAGAEGDALLDAIDEAEGAQIVVHVGLPGEPRYAFAHELIRQTLLASVSLPRRQRHHLTIAQAMDDLCAGAPEDQAARIAHHYFQAGSAADPARVRHYLSMAGDRAMESAAFEEALRFYEDAIADADDLEGDQQADLLYKLATALRSIGRKQESMDRYNEALTIHEQLSNTEAIEKIAIEAGFQLGWAGEWNEAVQIAARGINAVGSAETLGRGRLLGLAAIAMSWADQYDQAEEMLSEAEAIAAKLGGDRERAMGLVARAVHEYAYMDFASCLERATEAAELLKNEGELWVLADALSFMAFSFLFVEDIARTEEVLDELEPLAQKLGHGGALMFTARARSWFDSLLEWDPHRLLKFAEEDLVHCQKYELPWVAQSYAFIGRAKIWLGDYEEGIVLLERAAELDPPSALWGYPHGLLMLTHAQEGREDDAMRILEDCRSWLPDVERPNTLGRWCLGALAIEAAFILRNRALAEELAPIAKALLGHVDRGVMFRLDGRSLPAVAAMVHATLGDFDEAERLMAAGLKIADRYPRSWDAFDSRRVLGDMLIDRAGPGDLERARSLIEEAREGFVRTGTPHGVRLCDEALERIDAPAR